MKKHRKRQVQLSASHAVAISTTQQVAYPTGVDCVPKGFGKLAVSRLIPIVQQLAAQMRHVVQQAAALLESPRPEQKPLPHIEEIAT